MNTVARLTPSNLALEKAAFFADQQYHPKFVYTEDPSEVDLTSYGLPKEPYLSLAQTILDETYYGRNEADLLLMEGKIIPETEVTKKFKSFLDMHHVADQFEIIWSSSFVSRATVTSDTIKLRTGAEFRDEGLIGLIYHEVGTHALRTVNYRQQPWYKQKKAYGMKTNYLRTEEGLATLHALIPRDFRSLYSSAIRYVTVAFAQKHSLQETWQFLGKYVQDPETRWMIAFRQKRGITDTTLPGGFTKDLVYFEGACEVYHWLTKHQYDPTPLYFGKIAFKDTKKALEASPGYEPILPSFYTLNPATYAEAITAIGKYNHLDSYDF